MISPFFKKHSRGAELAVVVGSSSVEAALVERSDGQARITASASQEIVLSEDLDFKRFLEATLKAIERALSDLAKRAPRPKEIHLILAAPWYLAQTRVAKIERPEPFLIGRQFLESILSGEVRAFEKEGERSGSIILGVENRAIEVKTMKILLNGYETRQPLGKKVKTMSVSLFISLSSERILKSLVGAVHKIYHHGSPSLHSLPALIWSTTLELNPAEHDFLIVEVGGEITEVLLSLAGRIVEVTSFPLGQNFLLRVLAARFATLPAEVRSLLHSHLEGTLSPSVSGKVSEAIAHVRQEWLKAFQKVLELSAADYILPDKCFLLARFPTAPLFRDFIAGPALSQYTGSGKPFTVTLLGGDFFKKFLPQAPVPSPDTSIIIAAAFLARESAI